jgi:Ulp1 family protease
LYGVYFCQKQTVIDVQFLKLDEFQLLRLQQLHFSGRSPFVSISTSDHNQLDDGKWLNDNLLDMFMCWIVRKPTTSKSKVHVFSTHFYSTLRDEGVNTVSCWTTRKGIDVFSKKYIFIPIHSDQHWSLFVVLNPLLVPVPAVAHQNQHSDELALPDLLMMDDGLIEDT